MHVWDARPPHRAAEDFLSREIQNTVNLQTINLILLRQWRGTIKTKREANGGSLVKKIILYDFTARVL